MNTKISNKGFSSIIYFLSEVMFLGIGTSQILNSSKTNSIYSVILGSIFSIIILFFLLKIFNYEKDLNIFRNIEKLYGKILGNIINFFITILFILFFIYLLFNLNSYVQNKYLDSTPDFIIILFFLIPVIWCSLLNIKVISKVSLSVFIISIIMILFSASNLVINIDLENFKPFFNTSFNIILKDSLRFTAYFTTPVFMMLITPKNIIYDSKNLDKTIIKFYILSLINYLLIFIFIIGIFGIDLANIFTYPEYSLMKKINYFDFIQHIENVTTIQFLYSLFISAVMSIYILKEYLIYINKDKKLLYFIIILICLISSLYVFKNTILAYDFIKKYYIYFYSIPLFILVLISNIMIIIKKNRDY